LDFDTIYDAVRFCAHRWTIEILTALRDRGPMRFTDLLQTITPTPHSKSLSAALHRLQAQGLINHAGKRDGALYELTGAGHQLLPLVREFVINLQQWSTLHQEMTSRSFAVPSGRRA
jgi:DNA-binding HxlR family transcriptional regulator